MDRQLTVRDLIVHLAKVCKKRPDLLDKKIIISDDVEGNGYHGLWYGICADAKYADGYISDSETDKTEDLVILGQEGTHDQKIRC